MTPLCVVVERKQVLAARHGQAWGHNGDVAVGSCENMGSG